MGQEKRRFDKAPVVAQNTITAERVLGVSGEAVVQLVRRIEGAQHHMRLAAHPIHSVFGMPPNVVLVDEDPDMDTRVEDGDFSFAAQYPLPHMRAITHFCRSITSTGFVD